MDEPISRFIEARVKVLEAVRRFPPQYQDEILFGKWSLKDIIAHLVGWDQYFTSILSCLETEEEAPFWGTMTKFNEASISKRNDLPWEAVYDEFVKAGDEFIRRYRELSDEFIKTKFWKTRPYTPSKIIEINIHHYAKSHLPQIEKKLRDIADEQDSYHLSTTTLTGD